MMTCRLPHLLLQQSETVTQRLMGKSISAAVASAESGRAGVLAQVQTSNEADSAAIMHTTDTVSRAVALLQGAQLCYLKMSP